jgi:hypothetical protein
MASPNILNLSTVTGFTTAITLGITTTSLVSNASSSNSLYKISSLLISNIDGTNSADVTVKWHDTASAGGTGYSVASTIVVPPDSSINIIDKTSAIYLQENKSISVQASATSDLTAVCVYEVMAS